MLYIPFPLALHSLNRTTLLLISHKHSCACHALYYAADHLFVLDFQHLSESNVKDQKVSKYSIHLNG